MNALISILDDCLSIKGVPTTTMATAIARVMSKRHQDLREVITSEFRQGNFENADEDEFVSICYRLIRDAEEGVAKNNLRLMAQVINGMAGSGGLKAPNFLKFANILAGLSEEEISVLGTMVKEGKAYASKFFGDFELKQLLSLSNPGSYALNKKFEHAESIQQALIRTGLITMDIKSETKQTKKANVGSMKMYRANENESPYDVKTDVTYIYKLTPLMLDLLKYLPNHEVL